MIKQASKNKNPRSSEFRLDENGDYTYTYTVDQPLYGPQCSQLEDYLRDRISPTLNNRLDYVTHDGYGEHSFILVFSSDLYPGERLAEHLETLITDSPFMERVFGVQRLKESLWEITRAQAQHDLTPEQALAAAVLIVPEILTLDDLMGYEIDPDVVLNLTSDFERFTDQQAVGLVVQWLNEHPEAEAEAGLPEDELEQWMALGEYRRFYQELQHRYGDNWSQVSEAVKAWGWQWGMIKDLAEILAADAELRDNNTVVLT